MYTCPSLLFTSIDVNITMQFKNAFIYILIIFVTITLRQC